MKTCPECHTRAESSAFCNSCFYRFTDADRAGWAVENYRRKCRLASVAVGLGVAMIHYALLG